MPIFGKAFVQGAIASALVAGFLASAANAAPVLFNSRAAFDAATGGGLNFESFEAPVAAGASIAFSGFTVEEDAGMVGTPLIARLEDSTTVILGLSNATTDGSWLIVYTDEGPSLVTYTFTETVHAFGLDITAEEDTSVSIFGSVNAFIPLTANEPAFFGVIDTMTPLTTISFDVGGILINVGFDAVSFGVPAVPEPATLALFGIGLAGLGLARRRRPTA